MKNLFNLNKQFRLLCIFLAAVLLLGSITACQNRHIKEYESSQVLSRLGSRGEEVRKIQQKLKNWGYYSGGVDGIYGTKTQNAVKSFQRKNGLTADGIAGKDTLNAMGISSSSSSSGKFTSNDIYLLAKVIAAEARGESYTGQVAVGAVILNRVEHSSFPDSISGVFTKPVLFRVLPTAIGRSSRLTRQKKPPEMPLTDGIQRAVPYTIIILQKPLINGYEQDLLS